MPRSHSHYSRLKSEVIDQGLCTHCGLCAGLSNRTLEMRDTVHGPLPTPSSKSEPQVSQQVYRSCPGRGSNYPSLNKYVFGKKPTSWLLGVYQELYIGHSLVDAVRRAGASGGVITQLCLHLLESKTVDGIIMSRMRSDVPWEPETIIATTADQVRSCSQSIYQPVPVLKIVSQIKQASGKLALVGLPDQIAAVRTMQANGSSLAQQISVCIGPYVGTNMYFESIKSFLRSNGIADYTRIKRLNYRDGEWPGYLSITLEDGAVFKAEKFYYNYLIPFFITRSSLMSVDFTNELTDISVGDAWNPTYEKQGKGFSVVVARSKQGEKILKEMEKKHLVSLQPIEEAQALKMHAHMIEFKKRGAFIRLKFRKLMQKHIPDYGYINTTVPVSRMIIELCITSMFAFCGTRPVRWLMEQIPIPVMGSFFNFVRINWKKLTKSSKRKGLASFEFQITSHE